MSVWERERVQRGLHRELEAESVIRVLIVVCVTRVGSLQREFARGGGPDRRSAVIMVVESSGSRRMAAVLRSIVMSNETNVTHWIARLANPEHESEAARKIWDHCIDRLVLEASRRLRSFERPALVSPDDVAVSAFANFWQKAKQGKFPDLKDRDSLLGLLLRMTQQKAFDHVR